MNAEKVRLLELDDGALWRISLTNPDSNVLDRAVILALSDLFSRAEKENGLRAICLDGTGPNFSYGASVEEHLPGQVREMLETFHGLFRAMASSDKVLLAAVHGHCLGGGMELAAFCHRVFATPDARLGQPEIRLGVFPPVASVILPERMGRGPAEDLCLTGRLLSAEEARSVGLVDEVIPDPTAAALDYARRYLLPHSASSLRWAARAIRRGYYRRVLGELEALERMYLDDLMGTADAVEGIEAFVEKREPQWRNA
jgi:cyclohexa-1,5-dienecarbonyl-CoA hydratase